jgi:hypothetical protein
VTAELGRVVSDSEVHGNGLESGVWGGVIHSSFPIGWLQSSLGVTVVVLVIVLILLNLSLILRHRYTKYHASYFPLTQSHTCSSIDSPFPAYMATTLGPEWRRVSADSNPPFYMFDKPIQKSAQDDREYRIIKLENGLHATLVHDAGADSAAASLDVAVGHLSDPVGRTIEFVNSKMI